MQFEAVPIPPVPVIRNDFEDYENLPSAQASTADDSDIENSTPRVRRVLNTLQSEFTLTRNQNICFIVAMPSPKGGASVQMSPLTSDLANSPHHLAPSSAKPSKQSW